MRTNFTRLAWCLPVALTVLPACGSDITRDNPFDDEAPPSLQATATLRGQVLLQGAASFEGVAVQVVGPSTGSATTAPDGSFAIADLLGGTYELQATALGYRRAARQGIVLTIGGSLALDVIALEQTRGTITGSIALPSSSPLTPAGAVVTARRAVVATALDGAFAAPGLESHTGLTASDGSFAMLDVPTGTYTLSVSREDLAEVCLTGVALATDGEVVEVPVINVFATTALLKVTRGGALTAVTNADEVTVEIQSFGAQAVRAAADVAALQAASYAPMAVALPWPLFGADGDKQLLLQFLDACENPSRLYAASVTRDTTAPSGSVVIAEGEDYLRSDDGAAAVRFAATDATSRVVSMYVASDGGEPTATPVRDFASDLVLPLGAAQGPKTVRAVFVDEAGNASSIAADTITRDTVAPGYDVPAVVVAEADDSDRMGGFTATLLFAIDEVDPPTWMAVSSFPGTAHGPWQPFAQSLGWTFPVGADGPRSVYVRFRDEAGNTTDELSASVVIDATPPSSPFVQVLRGALSRADDLTRESNVELVLFAQGATRYQVSLDAAALVLDNPALPPQALPSGTVSFCVQPDGAGGCAALPPGTDEVRRIYARFYDELGNGSDLAMASLRVDNVAPASPSVAVPVLGDVVRHGGVLYTRAPVVTVSPSVTSETSAEVQLSVDGSFDAEPWLALAPSVSVVLSAAACTGEGLCTVRMRARDLAGNVSAAATAEVVLDTSAPTAPQAVASVLSSRTLTTALELVPGVVSDAHFSHFELFGSVATQGFVAQEDGAGALLPMSSVSFPVTLAANTTTTLRLRAVDLAGNVSDEAVVQARHDDVGPTIVEWSVAPGAALVSGVRYVASASTDVPVRLVASDGGAGISGYKLVVDGVDPGSYTPVSLDTDTLTLETTATVSASDGPHTVAVIVRDRAGSDSATASGGFTRDHLGPDGTDFGGGALGLLLEGGAASTRATVLGAEVGATDATSAVVELKLSEGGACAGGSWQLFDDLDGDDVVSVTWPVSGGDGVVRELSARLRDVAGNESICFSDTVTVDDVGPSSPVVTVERDAASIGRLTGVSLTLSVVDGAPGTTVELSNCADFCRGVGCDACCQTSAAPEPFAASRDDWSFTGCDDGLVTVFARFADALGNASAVAHDSIRLDTTPPSLEGFAVNYSASLPHGAAATASVSVSLRTLASDEGGGALSVAYVNNVVSQRCADVDFGAAVFQPLAPFATFLLETGDGDKIVCAQVRDAAGNPSAVSAVACSDLTPDCDRIFLDTVAPEPPSLLEVDAITDAATFTLTPLGAALDPAPSSGGLTYELRGGELADWTLAAGAPPFVVALLPNAVNRLALRLRDAAGNVSAASEVVVTHDDEAPTPPFLIATESRGGSITARWLPSAAADVHHYLLYYGNFPESYAGSFAPEGRSPIFVPAGAVESRLTGAPDLSTVYLAVSAVDRAGLEGAKSNRLEAKVFDNSPRVTDFFGGRAHDMELAGTTLVTRTSLGVETTSLVDPAAPSPGPRHFAPVDEIYAPASTAKGLIATTSDRVYVLGQDHLLILERSPTALTPAGAVSFAPGEFTLLFADEAAGRRHVTLAGNNRVAVYDVTQAAAPVLVARSDAVTADGLFTPRRAALQRLDLGAGPRALLVASSSGPDAFGVEQQPRMHLVDVTAAPTVLGARSMWGEARGMAVVRDVLYFSSGKMMNGREWVEALRLTAAGFEPLCLPVVPDGDWMTECVMGNGCGVEPGDFDPDAGCDVFGFGGVDGWFPPHDFFAYAGAGGGARDLLVIGTPGFGEASLRSLDVTDAMAITQLAASPGFDVGESAAIAGGAELLVYSGTRARQVIGVEASGAFVMHGSEPLFVSEPFCSAAGCQGICDEPWPCAPPNALGGMPALGMTVSQAVLTLAGTASASTSLSYASSLRLDLSQVGAPALLGIGDSVGAVASAHRMGDLVVAGDQSSLYTYRLSDPLGTTAQVSCHGGTAIVGGGLVACLQQGAMDENDLQFYELVEVPGGASPLAPLVSCDLGANVSGGRVYKGRTDQEVFVVGSHREGNVVTARLLACGFDADEDGVVACSCDDMATLPEGALDLVYRAPHLFYLSYGALGAVELAVELAVASVTPRGSLNLAGRPYRLIDAGNYLLVLTTAGSFLVDVSNPAQMKLAGDVGPGLYCTEAVVEGSRVYCGTDGVVVLDVGAGEAPVWRGTAPDLDDNLEFVVHDSTGVGVYATSTPGATLAIKAFDFTDPDNPRRLADTNIETRQQGAAAALALYDPGDGNTALVQLDGGSGHLWSWQTARAPHLVPSGSQSITAGDTLMYSLAQRQDRLFVGTGRSTLVAYDLPLGGGSLAYDDPEQIRLGNLVVNEDASVLFASGLTQHETGGGCFGNYPAIVAVDPTTMTRLGRTTACTFGFGYPVTASYGRCTSASAPCVASVDLNARSIIVWDVSDPAAMQQRRIICTQTYSGCDQGDWDIANVTGATLTSNGYLLVTSDGYAGSRLGVWRVNDDWSLSRVGSLDGSYSPVYYDDTVRRLLVNDADGLVVVNVTNPPAPSIERRIGFAGLGGARAAALDSANGALYVGFNGRHLRRIDVSAGYALAADDGGYVELYWPQDLEREAWSYYVVESGAVASFEAKASAPQPPGGAFRENRRHQYAPRSRVYAIDTAPGRLYVCRGQNADEGDVGVEVLELGTLAERPRVIGSVAAACTNLAVDGDLAWYSRVDGAGALVLGVVDLANERAPTVMAESTVATGIYEVRRIVAYGGNAYVSLVGSGPSSTQVGRLMSFTQSGGVVAHLADFVGIGSGVFDDVVVSGDRAYATQQPSYFITYDVADPASPLPIASASGASGRLSVVGAFGYITQPEGGTRVIDLR